MAARRYVVHGRVQGVGFRWFVERQARALKLSGYVRNSPDGSVEVVAQGPETVLDALREKLERGPIGSRVTSVESSAAPAVSHKDFQITH